MELELFDIVVYEYEDILFVLVAIIVTPIIETRIEKERRLISYINNYDD